MNTRKIKLALTIGLLNSESNSNILNSVRELMLGFKEVGAFLGMQITNKLKLNPNNVKQSYAMQFENCTLNLDLVRNPKTRKLHVQSFQLR